MVLSRVRVAGLDRAEAVASLAICSLAGLLAWLCADHPAILPPWAPWEFSWVEFLATGFSLWWYGRGLLRTPAALRPPALRNGLFLAGVALIYAVLQTRFLYMAEHMFFLNRVQHLVMHHLGPFLIALSWPGAMIRRGMPDALGRRVETGPLPRLCAVVQRPVLGAVLFVGLIFLWLIPPVHFRAMLDPRLFAVMNWSMVVDGLFFWFLVFDPRACPPSGLSFSLRLILAMSVQLPQIVAGAVIALAPQDLYPSYALCGRLFPAIGPLLDQEIGGSIILFPGGMMSAAAALILARWLWAEEARQVAVAEGATVLSGMGD